MRRFDVFTKAVLTVIAFCLILLVAAVYTQPGVVKAAQAKVVHGFLAGQEQILYRVWDDGTVDYINLFNLRDPLEKEQDRLRQHGKRDFEPRWYSVR
jgi:hypothetical protein